MSDMDRLNQFLVQKFVSAYGCEPGLVRESTPQIAEDLVSQVWRAFNKDFTHAEKFAAFNDMASRLRKLGYAREVSIFADLAIICIKPDDDKKKSDNNRKKILTVVSERAYALGLIEGRYDEAWHHYEQVLLLSLAPSGKNDTPVRGYETLAIKAAQNMGQIQHRRGMAGSVPCYQEALKFYDRADRLIDKSPALADQMRARYRAQIKYARAKTYTHLSRLQRASKWVSLALTFAQQSVRALKKLKNVDADMACFMAALGDAYAADRQKDAAHAALSTAFGMQQELWPTAAPRWSSTAFKLAKMTGEDVAPIFEDLRAFYGRASHPDMDYYRKHAPKSPAPRGPKGGPAPV